MTDHEMDCVNRNIFFDDKTNDRFSYSSGNHIVHVYEDLSTPCRNGFQVFELEVENNNLKMGNLIGDSNPVYCSAELARIAGIEFLDTGKIKQFVRLRITDSA